MLPRPPASLWSRADQPRLGRRGKASPSNHVGRQAPARRRPQKPRGSGGQRGPWGTCPVQFSSVQSLSRVQLFVTLWTAACQASLSITNSWSLLKLMSIELVILSNHLILCRPLLPSIFPSIRDFSNESVLCIRWPKYWNFSFSNRLSDEYSELISFRIDEFDLLAGQELSRVFCNTTVQKHQVFGAQSSL